MGLCTINPLCYSLGLDLISPVQAQAGAPCLDVKRHVENELHKLRLTADLRALKVLEGVWTEEGHTKMNSNQNKS